MTPELEHPLEKGTSPGEGTGYPLQYSGLENSMGYTVHGVTKNSVTTNEGLSLFTCSPNVRIPEALLMALDQ